MADFIQEKALFVGTIDKNIDLNVHPSSGEDYIKRVVVEASQCDDIVVAEISDSKLRKQTINIGALAGCIKAPESFRPTLEWQKCQIADFSSIRLHLAKIKVEKDKFLPKKEITSTFPALDDQTNWLKYCLGSNENGNTSDHTPTLGIILSMNQPTVEHVIDHLIDHINKNKKLQPELGRWLYSLLTVLELPLHPDMCSSLRTLARECSKLRANFASDENSYADGDDNDYKNEIASLNLFICLVSRYFRQLDLADP